MALFRVKIKLTHNYPCSYPVVHFRAHTQFSMFQSVLHDQSTSWNNQRFADRAFCFPGRGQFPTLAYILSASLALLQEKQPQAFIPTTDVDEALAAGTVSRIQSVYLESSYRPAVSRGQGRTG